MAEPNLNNLSAVDFDPFAGQDMQLYVPATESQLEIWLACKLGGDNACCAYNEGFTLTLTGNFDKAAFLKAIEAVVGRHESLRSVFSPDGANMCVYDHLAPETGYRDLSGMSATAAATAVSSYKKDVMSRPFDLVAGPLLRVQVFNLSAEQHKVVIIVHHIICDGWSFGVVLQELGICYSALVNGQMPELLPAPRFSDYAAQQAAWPGISEYRETEQYWLKEFQGGAPVLELPADRPRPAIRSFKSEHYTHRFSPLLTKTIKAFAAASGTSLLTILLTAFETWLQHLTGQDEVVTGLPAAGQLAAGMPGLVGHCVNLLPLKSRRDDEDSFQDYLNKRRPGILDAYDHQNITFGTLLKKLNVPRDASRLPLVPLVFNSDLGIDQPLNFAGLQYTVEATPRLYENFEIFLNLTSDDDSLIFDWSYNEGLFEEKSLAAMMASYEALLKQVTEFPASPLRDTLTGRTRIINGGPALNATEAVYPHATPLHRLISDTARQYPANPALKFEERVITYAGLEAAANRLAALLIDRGVSPGSLVALAVNRSVDMVIALLAILKTGAAYLPIDPEFPVERVKYILNDAEAQLLIVPADYKGYFVSGAEELILDEALAASSALSPQAPELQLNSDGLAYLLYTSGTTGYPKGVRVTHRNLVNFLTSMQREPGITAADKLLAVTTISFDIAGLELFLPLISGACVVIADANTARDGRSLLRLVRKEDISIMQATPYTWKIMLESGWNERLPLKVLCGGEALSKDLALRLLEKCGELWNMYGPTETTIWSAVKRITVEDSIISIGRPIANTRIYILDEQLTPVPAGATGELYIGGDGVAAGYLKRDELTRERFVTATRIEDGTLYRTGDLGRLLPDGGLQCLGRTDQQLKIRGYRIEPEGIASHLNRLGNIHDSVVVARNDPSGTPQLVAYVITKRKITADLPLQVKEWRDELRKVIQEYMVPQFIVVLKELPLTPNGKIDIRALPDPDYSQNRPAYVAPRTSIEQQVAAIWKKYLKIDHIGIFDDFFDLGGHSLIAVEIMTALEKETGKHLPLASLFNHSTIEKLALLLKMDGRSVTWDSLVPIKPLGNKMPLYIVHGAGLNVLLFNTLAMNMDADQPVYGLQARGMNGIDEPLNRMEDIAAHYIAEIMAQNPDGPYALAGYSFGGIIAFEMAKQLDKMGKEVKMLAMFDTYAYRSDHYDHGFIKMLNRLWFFIKQIFHAVFLFFKRPKATVAYKTLMLRRRVIRKYWELRYGREQKHEGFFGYSHKIDLMNEEAERKYRLEPYPLTVEVFKARMHTFYMADFKHLGWDKYALKGVHVHDIPGEHNYIFAPPNDKEFARILQACLDEAGSK